MLQYLVVLLDDVAASYCHYSTSNIPKAMPLKILKAGILFAMKENLSVQYVFPDHPLPLDIAAEIDSIDNSKFFSSNNSKKKDGDVIVCNSIEEFKRENLSMDFAYIIRTDKKTFFRSYEIITDILPIPQRLNIVILDVNSFTDNDFIIYEKILCDFKDKIIQGFKKGISSQVNLLNDRLLLEAMNNCDAGWKNITLAPNGKFYICPAFYYENKEDSIGDIEHGLDIKNAQLYRLDHAPLCRNCDAYQCKRCIWLNRRTTLEVNTPSHEQCVIAHIERNVSRQLLIESHSLGILLDKNIQEINYLDPFDNIDEFND